MRRIHCHADLCTHRPEWVLIVAGREQRLCGEHAAPRLATRVSPVGRPTLTGTTVLTAAAH